MLAVIWLIEIFNQFTNRSLNSFGVIPRNVDHAWGILTAPLIHHNLAHIIGNSIPLFILGILVFQSRQLIKVTAIVYIGSGILVWVFGRSAIHIGASSVVLGYWGFLLANAWFNRSLVNILLAVITILVYGGMIFSLLDFRQFISFESHIAGFLCGIVAAYSLKHRRLSTRS